MFVKESHHDHIEYMQQLAHTSMSSTARDLISTNTGQDTLISTLLENHCFSDVVMYLAHVLPYSKSLRWAYNSIKANVSDNLSDRDKQTLELTKSWFVSPDKSNRNQFLPNEALNACTPASWLAMAVYWSGGSINDNTKVQAQPAPPGLANSAIYSAIMLSIFQKPETERETIFKTTIQNALNMGILSH